MFSRKKLNSAAPIRMKKIIPVSPAVSNTEDRNAARVSSPENSASTKAPTAPTAAASVGENQPR